MLTPVDLKQKKFKNGLGFDKKDVTTFFEEVIESYNEQYKTNAQLKAEVITLRDENQHYKAMEEDLQKKLMIVEKNTEVSKDNASKEAKAMVIEAKAQADQIVSQAYRDRDKAQEELELIEAKYARYKEAFRSLIIQQMNYLDENDFDEDASSAKIDNAEAQAQAARSSNESALGGSGSVGMSRDDKRSNSSNVYGDTLGGEGIDPFSSDDLLDFGSSQKADESKDNKFSGMKLKAEEKPKSKFSDLDFDFDP